MSVINPCANVPAPAANQLTQQILFMPSLCDRKPRPPTSTSSEWTGEEWRRVANRKINSLGLEGHFLRTLQKRLTWFGICGGFYEVIVGQIQIQGERKSVSPVTRRLNSGAEKIRKCQIEKHQIGFHLIKITAQNSLFSHTFTVDFLECSLPESQWRLKPYPCVLLIPMQRLLRLDL